MFAEGARVVFLHAHPDDETLATGALIASLIDQGHAVAVVTATRGERGEVVPGVDTGTDLVAHREGELAAALAELGGVEHAWLGLPPARAPQLRPRRYQDSGMRWVTETLAGPDADAAASSLSLASVTEAAADLSAYLEWFGAEVLVSYDSHGGYGHPDHVACHLIAQATAAAGGIELLEVVSEPLLPQPGAIHFDHPQFGVRLRAALSCYASQFSLKGDEVEHVGGQRQPIVTDCWLRPVLGRSADRD